MSASHARFRQAHPRPLPQAGGESMISSLLLVGCGNMGGAMLEGWLAGGLAPGTFTIADPQLPSAPPGVTVVPQVAEQARVDAVLLAVKPQLLDAVAPAVGGIADEGTLLLSVLAGTPLARLDALIPRPRDKVRLMPNLAAALGKSPTALVAARPLAPDRKGALNALMAPLGPAEWLPDEGLLHAVTALAGSGPGFVYRFLAAMTEGGAALGLPAEQAARMALATVQGAAALAERSREDFGA